MTVFRNLAQYRPLESTQRQGRMARFDIICLHTMVGSLASTDEMFKRNGWSGTESHFGVGGAWGRDADHDLDGVIYQWQDTAFRADANLEGNDRLISIETADNAPQKASDIRPWTQAQQNAIVRLLTALCREHNIPAVLIPDSGPGRRGIGYHRLGVQHSGGTHPKGFLQPGCERWSTAVGKECPGPARIAQIPGIIDRVRAALSPAKPQEADMAFKPEDVWSDRHDLTDADVAAYGDPTLAGEDKSHDEIVRFPPATARLRREMKEEMRVLREQLAEIKGLLQPPTPGA